MASEKTRQRRSSRREREHAAMLEAALARPGVREAIAVYRGWQEKDRGLDGYRSAVKAVGRTTTSKNTEPSRSATGACEWA